jgi:hypothetical protein
MSGTGTTSFPRRFRTADAFAAAADWERQSRLTRQRPHHTDSPVVVDTPGIENLL